MTASPIRVRAGVVLVLTALGMVGCAPARPTLAGGRTTPAHRTDLAVGGAVRVVVDPPENVLPDAVEPLFAFAAPGGTTPVALLRHGLGDDADLSLEVVGPELAGTLRGAIPLGSGLRFMAGITPRVGYVHRPEGAYGPSGNGVRVGAEAPLLLAIDLFSLYEAWLGARVGVEHAAGELGAQDIGLTGLRVGGVVGLAVGLRRFAVLAELGVDYEARFGQVGAESVAWEGWVLVPALALRLRF